MEAKENQNPFALLSDVKVQRSATFTAKPYDGTIDGNIATGLSRFTRLLETNRLASIADPRFFLGDIFVFMDLSLVHGFYHKHWHRLSWNRRPTAHAGVRCRVAYESHADWLQTF